MSILYLLILISIFVAGGFLLAFLWAVSQGQFEDDCTPAIRILFEENILPKKFDDLQKKEETIESTKK